MIDTLFDLLGTAYQKGNLPQAERIAGSILQAVPDDVVSMQFLGLVCYRTGRRDEAIQAFNTAAASSLDRGAGAHVDDRLSAAVHCLRAARRRGSTLVAAWYDLGLVLFRLRREEQAVSAFQSALAGQPDFRAAQRAIDRISERPRRQGFPAPSRNGSAAGKAWQPLVSLARIYQPNGVVAQQGALPAGQETGSPWSQDWASVPPNDSGNVLMRRDSEHGERSFR